MFNLNTLVRVIRTLALVLVFAEAAMAQSTLNFVRRPDGADKAITIANSSSNFADVQFTFYKPDGGLPATNVPNNPVSYRIAPKGRISMMPADVFGGVPPAGWIQATSSISGLSASAVDSWTDQVIAFPLPAAEIQLTNTGSQSTNGTVIFYDGSGRRFPGDVLLSVAAHNQASVSVPSGAASAHITSSAALAGTSFISAVGAPILLAGQSASPVASTRVFPFFRNGNGFAASLTLTNSSSIATNHVQLFYVTDDGINVNLGGSDIPANGSWSPDFSQFSEDNGYLRVVSDNGPLSGGLILQFGTEAIAVPLQASAMDRFLFNDPSKAAVLYLIGNSLEPIPVEVTYVGPDGATVAQKAYSVGSTQFISVADLVPAAAEFAGGFVAIRSTNGAKLFALGIDSRANSTVVVPPQLLASVFVPNPIVTLPLAPLGLHSLATGRTDIRVGDVLRGQSVNVSPELPFSVTCGGKTADHLLVIPDPLHGNAQIEFAVPSVDPGFVNCKLRSGGLESGSFSLKVMDAAGTLTDQLSGQAFYQKIEVTDVGLDLDPALPKSLKPIRNGRVEVVDNVTRKVISASETDGNGNFVVAVPPDATSLSIQVVSRMVSLDLKVANNTNGNQFYVITSAEVDMHERPLAVRIADRTRVSGAFNILEQVERANDFVHAADPTFTPFPFTIFWSDKNQNRNPLQPGYIATTSFNLATGTATILGDRATDSDEYDDSVLLHEYAHMLAAKVSRDDSPGGQHHIGDSLDPRVAWSEGWANFFSGAVRNDSIYRDSSGPNGVNVMRFDLEENFPAGSANPGYGSETSVQALLWDFLDDKSELDDTLQLDFSQIWAAFTDLKGNRFIYLPYFLDHIIERNKTAADSVQRMTMAQAIYFQPGVNPSVMNPFPVNIALGSSKTGEVDSLTTKRTNLAQSSHFFAFSTTGGQTSIRLDILPPAANAKFNDLDLFLFDMNGKLIAKSDTGLSGKGELIPVVLPAGAYVIEVRSYYTNDKGGTVFNSGKYNLTLLGQ